MYPDANIPQVMSKVRHSYFTAFVISAVLALVFLGFGIWAYLGKDDAEKNLDQHIATAVADAELQLTNELTAGFEEEYKKPFTTITLAESLGKIVFEYPKNWGVYYIEKDSGNTPLDLFAHPKAIPDIAGITSFGLRLQIVNSSYDEELGDFDKDIEKGEIKSKAVRSNGVLGVRLDGEIERDINGIMVMFPLRDKTLKLWTESTTFKADFETALEALVFTP